MIELKGTTRRIKGDLTSSKGEATGQHGDGVLRTYFGPSPPPQSMLRSKGDHVGNRVRERVY